MSSPRLRGATEADAEAVAELFTQSFGSSRPMDAEEIRVWLRNEEIAPDDVRVLEIDGRVVGCGDLWIDSEAALDAAAPGWWDVFFQAFLELRERGLVRAGLGVDAKNPTGAVALYENAGMRQVTRNDNWVRDA